MTDHDQSQQKRPPGRPPKYAGEGKRQNFSFRITPAVRERLIAAVRESGRSLSEEIEFRIGRDLNWEKTKGDIDKMLAEATAIRSDAYVHALRAAALLILRDIEARPRRVVIDLDTLLAEADGVMRALRSGFVDDREQPTKPPAPRRSKADEQALAQKAQGELESLRPQLADAERRTQAAEKKSA